MIKSGIVEMKGSEFPFGQLEGESVDPRKLQVRRRVHYRNSKEQALIREKVDSLKTLSHRNCINLRKVSHQPQQNCLDLYYGYVPLRLEQAFEDGARPSVKDLHKQFIELAIHLAKHSILTSFSPSRCGAVLTEGRVLVKYFLPLNQIVITSSRNMLERAVQLFNLQSMHYLDTLSQGVLNSTLDLSHRSSTKKRTPEASPRPRKESQPTTLYFNSTRKMSLNPLNRKLSHLSKELSDFSEMRRKRTKESTRNSGGSFTTLHQLLRQDSDRDLFKSCLSENRLIEDRVNALKERSRVALREFSELKQLIGQHRSLSVLLERVRGQLIRV